MRDQVLVEVSYSCKVETRGFECLVGKETWKGFIYSSVRR